MVLRRLLMGGAAATVVAAQAAAQTAPAPAPAPAPVVDEAPSSGNPLANRVSIPAALRFLQAQGVKLTLLGTEGDFTGYLGESPNGRMQVFYVGPSGTHLVAGLLFNAEGQNRTGVQLGEMQRRFDVAQKQMTGEAPKTSAATPIPPPASVPAQPSLPELGKQPSSGPVVNPAAPPNVDGGKPAASQIQAQPAPRPAAPERQGAAETSGQNLAAASKYISALDRGAVERALMETAWFRVGVEEAPILYMVVDPQCAYCHAAWTRLQPLVYDRKLQVRVTMIAGLKGSVPMAISILARPNPGGVWLGGEGSRDGVTVQDPPAQDSREYVDAARMLDVNANFVRQFGLTQTPTFLYFGTDNRLYQSVGLPDDAAGFLGALLK